MLLSDFQFDLPSDRIAKYPLACRHASRLLCLNGESGEISHKQFMDLVDMIEPQDLLIFNNTRVIPARLKGVKETGGRVEMLVERILTDNHVLAHVRASKALKAGTKVLFAEQVVFEMVGRSDDLFELRCLGSEPVLSVLERIGEIPLPVYFQREAEESDRERYQTVYAEHKGSVAAPTAGLHFDQDVLAALQKKGVETAFLTLHVGAGTFSPVRVEKITEHKMHPEYIDVPAELCQKIVATKARGGRVIAVGTTTLRSLESACRSGQLQPFQGNTDIFIYPGYTFQCVDALVTNLHTPGSTLLMLVSAFAGYDHTMQAYQAALTENYRFYSYGDAMFITRQSK